MSFMKMLKNIIQNSVVRIQKNKNKSQMSKDKIRGTQ